MIRGQTDNHIPEYRKFFWLPHRKYCFEIPYSNQQIDENIVSDDVIGYEPKFFKVCSLRAVYLTI